MLIMQPWFDQYAQALIDQKYTQRGHYLKPEEIAELKKEISRESSRFIMSKLIPALSAEDQLKWINMRAKGKPQGKIDDFIYGRIKNMPNWESLYTNALVEFRKAYVGESLWVGGIEARQGSGSRELQSLRYRIDRFRTLRD